MNCTRSVVTDSLTGEILEEFYEQENSRKRLYHGPRKYYRTMELYDKAQLLLDSRVGIQIMIYLKQQVYLSNYRIQLNQTWLAEDLGVSRDAVAKNIKKLVDHNLIIKEKRGMYFISPDLFWIQGLGHEDWQKIKKEYILKMGE